MYDYRENVMDDIRTYIENEIALSDWTDDRDGLEEQLNDVLFCEDSVTGNASGSYTFCRNTAREYVSDNLGLLAEACEEFGADTSIIGEKFLDSDYEWMDVTIRCYLLGQCISDVLDEMESDGAFEGEE